MSSPRAPAPSRARALVCLASLPIWLAVAGSAGCGKHGVGAPQGGASVPPSKAKLKRNVELTRARQEKLGKAIGDDFREGKITLPVILAYRRGDEEERAFWRRTLEDVEQDEGGADLRHALTLLDRHQSLSDTVTRARHYGAIARDALGIFPDGPVKSVLIDIIDFCIDRAF